MNLLRIFVEFDFAESFLFTLTDSSVFSSSLLRSSSRDRPWLGLREEESTLFDDDDFRRKSAENYPNLLKIYRIGMVLASFFLIICVCFVQLMVILELVMDD
jgi:hypothetical protein